MKFSWHLGVVAGVILAIFSLYPQMKMLYNRGAEWNGHYAYNDIDEVAYAAYLKALIDGRPRKNDPYTGRDQSAESPQPESLFSIQFAAPYTIAIPARVLGIGAPWAMTIGGAVAAFLTGLAIFWLLMMITRDGLFSMAGTLVVAAGGAIFAGEGAIGEILGSGYSYPYFPGFRRYIPALALPAFFAFLALLWFSFCSRESLEEASDRTLKWASSAVVWTLIVVAFGYTVFSYFYVWTTAAAFLACLALCWIAFRPDGWFRDLKGPVMAAPVFIAVLGIYAWLLSQRSQTLDHVQLLVYTREPDLTRLPELIGVFVLAGILLCSALGVMRLRERSTIFVMALALTPAILFNQQIITGRSLQPIHYQVFIGNYVAGLALVSGFGLIWRNSEGKQAMRRLATALIAVIATVWGIVECHYTVRVLDEVNVLRDQAYLVGKRLTEISADDPNRYKQVVLHLGIAEGDDLPTIAPQSVLWARHQHVFPGVEWEESKERYYQQLLYQGVGEQQLADGMKKGEDFVSMIALFGWGRHTDRLNSEYKPLTFGEIDAEASAYARYRDNFDARASGAVKLDFLVLPIELEPYLSELDRWYRRTDREQFGQYVLYRLTLN